MIGKTLSHYQITEKLGEGGMGVVYKARDSHLDRFVAIKVLPPEKVADPDRKRRFVQEAKAASALNHPNIITIHDITQEAGTDFIVMEFVAGKTLDELIPRKGMRLSTALKYAVQIADALARAHGAGIIHRDLKPSNVMVDDHGLVKILDFGLAKLAESASPEAPTVATRTEAGMILGTAAYMSPEQAEGKQIDTRSDIFSFGSMLYEMLTGQRAFRGDTRASTIASILREEPKPISQVSEGMPRDAEKIVRRCLRKEPEHRFQHMDDLKVALEELKEESDSGTVETEVSLRARSRHRLGWALGILAVFTIVAVTAWLVRPRVRTVEPPPASVPLTSYPGFEGGASFSPDGNQVAFHWCQEGQPCHIYIKQVGTESLMRLTTNPADERFPAWSPDGRWIAFLRDLGGFRCSVVLMPPVPGPERVLTEVTLGGSQVDGHFISWSSDSRWIAVTAGGKVPEPAPLRLISVEGNEKRQITFPPKVSQDSCPAFSPDGHRLAFFRWREADKSDLYLLELSDELKPLGDPKLLYAGKTTAQGLTWTADVNSLIFATSTLSGVSHQVWRMAISGSSPPQRLASIGTNGFFPVISRRGDRLAYVNSTDDWNIWKMEMPSPKMKSGAPIRLVSTTRSEYKPEFSPDGKKIAFVSDLSGAEEIWVCDADGANAAQLTRLGGEIGCIRLRWSPDARSLTFSASPEGKNAVYTVNANGGRPQRLTMDPGSSSEPYWSGDGKWILFGLIDAAGKMGIFKLPAGGGSPVQVTDDPGWMPIESPDGKFIYYHKNESEGFSLWRVASTGGETRKVVDLSGWGVVETLDSRGAYWIQWSNNSLHFLDTATGKTERLASFPKPIMGYSVSPDGRQSVYGQLDQSGSDLMLVENFR